MRHKLRTIIIVAVLAVGGFYGYKKFTPAAVSQSYVTAQAETTTITVSVSGSGQVSDENSIELKPSADSGTTISGVISETVVKVNDLVKEGQLIATIDQSANQTTLTQAQASLANAQASYKKLVDGSTADDIRISQNSVTQAENNYHNAQTSLENTKKSTADAVSKAEKDLDDAVADGPVTVANKRDTTINAIQDKLISAKTALDSENKILDDETAKTNLSSTNPVYLMNAQGAYNEALVLHATAEAGLSVAKTTKSDADIYKAVDDTIAVFNKILESNNNLYSALQNSVSSSQLSQTQIDSWKTAASGQMTSANSAIGSLQTARQALSDTIKDATDAVDSARRALSSAQLSQTNSITSAEAQITSSYNSWQSAQTQLDKLKAPATPEELKASQANLASARSQLSKAQSSYNANRIVAPFDGQIAVLNVQKGAQVNGSTIIATIITAQKIAEMPLNEVDAAKVKIGDKAILTFDAIDGLSITGKVTQIDALGAVSQGVVTYDTKINFDTQDERIKTGMSVSAEIITDVKTDVLAVPNAAVKTDNGTYVQVLDASGKPQEKIVAIGLANDTLTEIISGLSAGDPVVTQTVTSGPAATARPTTGGGGFGIPGVGGGVRMRD